MNKKRLYVLFAIIIVALLPTAVFASVVITSTHAISVSGKAPVVYMAQGPNYNTANADGFIYAPVTGSPLNITSGTTIDVNTTAGSGYVYLLNVLYINSTVAGTLYINGTLPSGVTIYITTSPATVSGSASSTTLSINATAYTPGTPITLNGSSTSTYTLYVSFELSGTATGSGALALNYYS
ncbi:hypothetical protein [Picrophilus oshimae]|uniref:Hypothetical exported protein n=1 Tax=Picrophilus torridus (strain ATCC 700027 / DSM 9790 / JCM 10055 / NBRC 100828 / KAW 2/3) TaxID=1122961 RepID=Q6L1J6_PICTO|nr:hypothetical protein [Picrophilus oshimae]AAT43156.1 hypothetical exported protein [Picrophilus oshimae DSM 9789]